MQVFNVQGMTCGHCVKAVTRAVQEQDAAAVAQIEVENFSKPWKEADFLGAVRDEKALYLVAYLDNLYNEITYIL